MRLVFKNQNIRFYNCLCRDKICVNIPLLSNRGLHLSIQCHSLPCRSICPRTFLTSKAPKQQYILYTSAYNSKHMQHRAKHITCIYVLEARCERIKGWLALRLNLEPCAYHVQCNEEKQTWERHSEREREFFGGFTGAACCYVLYTQGKNSPTHVCV